MGFFEGLFEELYIGYTSRAVLPMSFPVWTPAKGAHGTVSTD